MIYRHRRTPEKRRAAAAAEAAILLPTLILLAFIAYDYCRVFQYAEVVNNCARAGAMYMVDPTTQAQSPYYNIDPNQGVKNAVSAEWPSNLGSASSLIQSGQLVVQLTYNNAGTYPIYAKVQVTYTFHPVVSYLIIPASVTVSRSVEVQVMPEFPHGLQ